MQQMLQCVLVRRVGSQTELGGLNPYKVSGSYCMSNSLFLRKSSLLYFSNLRGRLHLSRKELKTELFYGQSATYARDLC